MSEKNNGAVLKGQIKNGMVVINKIDSFYRQFCLNDRKLLGKKTPSAIIIAEIFTDFYTCAETIFLRISRFFENDLSNRTWHKDLLDKMILEIQGVRQAVLGDETYKILIEFLKFRHFRRYYFEFEYDWDRIDYLEKKYKQVMPLLKRDLDAFCKFLDKINKR